MTKKPWTSSGLQQTQTGSPLKLVGVNEQDDQLFINQTTTVVQVNASDTNFECKPPQDDKNMTTNNDQLGMVAVDINLADTVLINLPLTRERMFKE